MRIAVPDLISNSYFPAPAAVELGFFKAEGLEMELDLVFPVDRAYEELRDGKLDFVAGSSHSALAAFPDWKGVKLLASLSQGMYWFLVLRADLGVKQGDIEAVKGLRIGAAPWVEMGLRRLLEEAGIQIEADKVDITPVPGAIRPGVSFGVTAAEALGAGKIDGFWANGMGAEIAVRKGIGTIVLDVRRGDGPAPAFNYTQPVLATTDALIAREPETAKAAIRAIIATQKALRLDISHATTVGKALFPSEEASMIADVVERDLEFYEPMITGEFVAGMNKFAAELGLLSRPVAYEDVVAKQFSDILTV
ncbi:MAG: nitrate ABC transporter substrate-binding protein [Rhodospirillaceae bacterium]|nr:nitrate ABC transporter substrate-binding protein [Rhodospirillaceae bacterium]|tara:strand:+ start:1551 stop:2474 length:924 start_codon:yes stop_codon:yes gene_type:complete